MISARRLFGYLETGNVPGSNALDESLEKHDKKYHPDGYKTGDVCNRRGDLAKEDDNDRFTDKKPSNGQWSAGDRCSVDYRGKIVRGTISSVEGTRINIKTDDGRQLVTGAGNTKVSREDNSTDLWKDTDNENALDAAKKAIGDNRRYEARLVTGKRARDSQEYKAVAIFDNNIGAAELVFRNESPGMMRVHMALSFDDVIPVSEVHDRVVKYIG